VTSRGHLPPTQTAAGYRLQVFTSRPRFIIKEVKREQEERMVITADGAPAARQLLHWSCIAALTGLAHAPDSSSDDTFCSNGIIHSDGLCWWDCECRSARLCRC